MVFGDTARDLDTADRGAANGDDRIACRKITGNGVAVQIRRESGVVERELEFAAEKVSVCREEGVMRNYASLLDVAYRYAASIDKARIKRERRSGGENGASLKGRERIGGSITQCIVEKCREKRLLLARKLLPALPYALPCAGQGRCGGAAVTQQCTELSLALRNVRIKAAHERGIASVLT